MLNWKKAIVSAVVFYAIVFLAATILMFSLSLAGDIFGAAMVVLVAILAVLLSKYYYFKGMKAKPMDGLLFGIVMTVAAVLIEIPVMVYGFAKDMGWAYFASWHIMLGYLLVVIIPPILVYLKKV